MQVPAAALLALLLMATCSPSEAHLGESGAATSSLGWVCHCRLGELLGHLQSPVSASGDPCDWAELAANAGTQAWGRRAPGGLCLGS